MRMENRGMKMKGNDEMKWNKRNGMDMDKSESDGSG